MGTLAAWAYRRATAVAKLTAAGNAVWRDDGPDFIFNRLEVSGPHEPLYDFIGAASGPGFVDWRPEWHSVYEQIYFGVVRGGAPTREAAEHLARKLRDILWRRHEEERVRAELDSHRVPLDLNALIPIPRRVLRKGFVEAGQEWMWANWGVRWPIRRVTFAIERRDKTSGSSRSRCSAFSARTGRPGSRLCACASGGRSCGSR